MTDEENAMPVGGYHEGYKAGHPDGFKRGKAEGYQEGLEAAARVCEDNPNAYGHDLLPIIRALKADKPTG